MPPQKLLYQGAEAKIILSNSFIIKDRIPKSYRIKELDDKIRKQRTKAETKLLEKASKIINTPNPLPLKELNIIKMPFIDGEKLSEHLDNFPLEKQKEILGVIGQEVAKLHDAEIIHGDLTTSNMILVEKESDNEKNKVSDMKADKRLISNKQHKAFTTLTVSKRSIMTKSDVRELISNNFKVFFVDFGLGFISNKVEDKAVDIHLLKQALEAKHFKNWQILFEEFLKGYKKSKEASKVFERLEAVEKRGRYRH